MKLIFLTLLFLFSCQDNNSNSGDRGKYGPVEFDEADPNFSKAYYIVQDRCVNCHSGYHNSWAEYKSNAAWISSGLIIQNDSQNSSFLNRIINSAQVGANMPLNGTALPDAEYDHLVQWIEGMP
jgi:uncharacterized membrane protein